MISKTNSVSNDTNIKCHVKYIIDQKKLRFIYLVDIRKMTVFTKNTIHNTMRINRILQFLATNAELLLFHP